jgi:hypothetical protein
MVRLTPLALEIGVAISARRLLGRGVVVSKKLCGRRNRLVEGLAIAVNDLVIRAGGKCACSEERSNEEGWTSD